MRKIVIAAVLLMVGGCGDSFRYKDFVPGDPAMDAGQFRADSAQCETDKDKHSSKIQGRELGFKGEHAAYLGCMKLKGWDRKTE